MGRLPRVAVLVVAMACLSVPPALAHVDLAGNSRGDQLLLHEVLGQSNRPLFAGTRPAGGPFGALAPVAPAARFAERAAVVDDAGGSVIVWRTIPEYFSDPPPGPAMAAIRRPGEAFGPPVQLADDASSLRLFGNRRGDALAIWTYPVRYSFRPAGGEFGEPKALDWSPVGVAIEDDGTAVAVLTERHGYPEPDSLAVAERPPGGEFGPSRPIPGTAGALGPHLGAASNGRALLVWVHGRSVLASERLPGGEFGSPAEVPPQDAVNPPIVDVQIRPTGAAAIEFESRDQFAFRQPGDPIARFTGVAASISSGASTLDLNDRGDAAAAWHGWQGQVLAAYHGAGEPRWSKVVTVSRAPPFDTGTYRPPALAFAHSGWATIGWEGSNGDTVRTYTRALRGRSLGHTRVVDSIPSYVREGPPSACRLPGARALRHTRRVTLFKTGIYLYACLLARGAPVFLGGDSPDILFPSHTISIEGPLVAYGYNSGERGSESSYISVIDLRDPVFGLNRAWSLDTSEYGTLVATRLRANGAIAWIACPDPSYGFGSVKACRRVGGSPKHVWVWAPRSEVPRLVDRGRRIDPRTFRLRGSRLSWRNGAKLRRARLR